MKAYFSQGHAVPHDFRSRYTDGELEEQTKHIPVQSAMKNGHPARAPSFAEQEAMLRKLSKLEQGKNQPGPPR